MFKNGCLASFQALDVKRYHIFESNFLFEGGRIVLKESGFAVDVYKAGPSPYFSGYNEPRRTRPPFKANYKRNFMVEAVNHIIDCVNNKKESISSGIDGLMSLKCVKAAVSSAESGGKRICVG